MFHNVMVLQGLATCKCGQFLRPAAGGVVFFFFVLADPQFRHKFFTLWGSGHSPGRLGLEVLNSFAFWVGACPCKLFSVGGTGMY